METIRFSKEEKKAMEIFQKTLDRVCANIEISNCELECPFYGVCRQGHFTIKDAFNEMINNADEIYTD